jgi:2,4-dienoyl-CoA reductase-like NADH-dependent reductase (Old Yellow Enzyme family)/pyruvate/2-oxoglutarate dehydrogenase complex dihydrolipoamide dehydrogenase (E3) component
MSDTTSSVSSDAPKGLRRTFTSLQVGPITIPNRVVRTAHLTKMALGPAITDDLIAYHVARGEGGVGLSILEATAVHPSSVLGLVGFDDRITEGYQRLMEAIRPTGMRMFQQLWHAGHVYPAADGGPPRGASEMPGVVSGFPALPIATDEIPEFVTAFADTAKRSTEAGIDGVELAASHGYLFHQFLSPLTNTRTDWYGGDLENRMRFLVETLIAVREAIGPDKALGVRVGAGQVAGGLTEPDLAKIVRYLADDGLVDYINVTMGDYYRMADMMGGMDRPAGYMLDSSGQITAGTTKVPRLITGRFRTLEEVERVLAEGTADMVSMVRAHIADPDLVRKTREGRALEVRPCIGCNQGCIGRTSGLDARLGCVVNPAIGRENTLSEKLISTTSRPRKVLVVGGGPAGLEAARTARLRGHDVTLHEAFPDLGGNLIAAARGPKMQGIDDIREWLEQEVRRLGVVVHTGSYLDIDDIVAAEPDAVVLATGGENNRDGRSISDPGTPTVGIDLSHVITPVELFTEPRELGNQVLVFDEMGQYEAIAVTEYLLERGHDVTVVTRFPAFGVLADAAMRVQPALSRFENAPGNLTTLTRSRLVSVESGKVTVKQSGAGKDHIVGADTVVLVTYRRGRRGLADELRAHPHIQVHVVGDARSGRDLQVAIREGHIAGRMIE